MRDRSIPLLPLGVLVLLVILTFWLSRFVQPSDAKADGSTRHDPDLIIENFSAKKLNQDGDVQYVVDATKMTHFPDDDSSTLETVMFQATEAGKPPVTARAPHGSMVRKATGSDEVSLSGGVVIESPADATYAALKLSTPKVTVYPDDNLLRSTDGVVLESAGGRLTARGFELNSETRRLAVEQVVLTYQRYQR